MNLLGDTTKNVKTFSRGDVIAEEGSPGGGWYVLLSGRVAVFKQGTKVTEFSTRGMIFGEISSILSKPRTARLVAVDPCEVMHFEANLDELVAKYPSVAKTVLISLAQRLEKTTEALWVAVQSHPKSPDTPAASHPAIVSASTGTETSAGGAA
jgi:CRP-like cAMP-binding protein